MLVPFDFEEVSHHALAWATDLHKTTGAEPMLMIHAVDSRPAVASEGPVVVIAPSEDEINEFRARMVEAAHKLNVRAVAEVHVGPRPPGETIIDLAGRRDIELIVMGTHGRSGLERLVLGSVAEHVVRHATCPVVTVRDRPEARR
jgi:universal stress protein A